MVGFRKIEFTDLNVDKLLDIQHNQLSIRVEKWTYKRSGGLLIQYYNSNFSFYESLLLKEFFRFHYL